MEFGLMRRGVASLEKSSLEQYSESGLNLSLPNLHFHPAAVCDRALASAHIAGRRVPYITQLSPCSSGGEVVSLG